MELGGFTLELGWFTLELGSFTLELGGFTLELGWVHTGAGWVHTCDAVGCSSLGATAAASNALIHCSSRAAELCATPVGEGT